jgi:hypothetical protein
MLRVSTEPIKHKVKFGVGNPYELMTGSCRVRLIYAVFHREMD